MPESRILLGVIGRPHGVRGLLRVTSHTADPTDLAAYGPLTDAKGRRFRLQWRGDGVAELSELVGDTAVKVADRTTAETLTNTRLYIDRTQLPQPEAEEFYLADLLGLAALGPDGAALGSVTAVHDYGAGASLEIARDGAPPLLVPFTRAAVPEVDLPAGRLTVLPPVELDAPAGPDAPTGHNAPAGPDAPAERDESSGHHAPAERDGSSGHHAPAGRDAAAEVPGGGGRNRADSIAAGRSAA